jgi:predicted lactoylglutathione lyase
MTSQIFVNLPVKDLNKTIEFFKKLGFEFNPQFTDENATCMIVNENIFVMLLVEKFFKSFTKKEICDTIKDTEVIIALSTESREKVDRMIQNVIEAGAQNQGNHKTMDGCTDVDFRTLTVIFGKLYTWMKKLCEIMTIKNKATLPSNLLETYYKLQYHMLPYYGK